MFAYTEQLREEKFGRCYFRVSSFFTTKKVASMYQDISLENFRLLISTGAAHYNASTNFQCFGEQYASIELRFTDVNNLRYRGVDKGEDYQ